MTGQSRTQSAVEAAANVLVGYGIGVAAQAFVFPVFGLHVSFTDNLLIGATFTVVSLARSFLLRRLFEAWRTA